LTIDDVIIYIYVIIVTNIQQFGPLHSLPLDAAVVEECPFYTDMIGTTGDSFPMWLGYLPYVAWMKLSKGRKWTLSPKFIGHHPGSVFFQNAELKQIWSDQTNPT